MVDLTHIDLATKEDRAYGIEHWARLFKASTWEELKMIAKNSQVLTEAWDAEREQLLAKLAEYEAKDNKE